MIDLDRIAYDTPAAVRQVFLDSAGSSLQPAPVLRTVLEHHLREGEVGGYVAAAERSSDLAAVRTTLATFLGTSASESIFLTDSSTRAWSQIFYAIDLKPSDRILLTGVEYASNAVAALQRVRASGATVEVVPSTPTGTIDLVALAEMLDERVRILSLVHVPSNGGLVNPVREVADLVHAYGGLVLLDACQSVGQMPIDVTELDVDALAGAGRKWMRGPRGTGFGYVRPSLIAALEPPVIDLLSATWTGRDSYELRPDATRFELWEADHATRLGLGAAADYAMSIGLDAIEEAVVERAAHLRAELRAIAGVTVTDLGERQCGIVTFTVEGRSPDDVQARLADANVTVGTSGRTTTLLDMDARGLTSVVRASPHYFVTPAQIEAAAAAVRTIA